MPSQNDTFIEPEPAGLQYTPDDLSIIYEIVALATITPGKQSFKPIWEAYDTILRARQIDTAGDSFYYRFLLQMQGAPGKDLQEKFIHVSNKLGIHLDGIEFYEPKADITAAYHNSRFEEVHDRREEVRRALLEEESYHAEDESHPKKETKGTGRRIRSLEVRSFSDSGRGRSTPKATTVTKGAGEVVHMPPGTISAHSEDESVDIDPSLEESVGPRVPEDIADHLYVIGLRKMLRKYLHDWHNATVRSVVSHEHLEKQAVLYDRRMLLRQAFDMWQEKKWFAAIEHRVEAKYNQKLLVGAWSIWIRRTAVNVQQAHEVRQRIIERKYFNGWRDVVATDEKRAYDFQLSTILTRWRNQVKRQRKMETQALEFYEGNLVHKAYWLWFFNLCGILAPKRHHEILIQQQFYGWLDKSQKIAHLNHVAQTFFRSRTLHAVFSRWVQRTEQLLEKQDTASNYFEWRIKHTRFDAWKRMAMMAPLGKAMQTFSNDRIAHEHFTAWRIRAKNQVLAVEFFKKTLSQKVLRNWRLALRKRVLAEYQDNVLRRVFLQHWARQERLKVVTRVNNRKLARNVLRVFAANFRNRNAQIWVAYRQTVAFRDENLARAVLSCWCYKISQTIALNARAERQHEHSLARKVYSMWQNRVIQRKVYDQWAADANYYFTAKRSMDRFKQAFHDARKNRLRNAYQIVARKRKENLAGLIISTWRSKRDKLVGAEQLAHNIYNSKLEEISTTCFEHWLDRTQAVQTLLDDANAFNNRRLLHLAFHNWTERYQRLQDLNHLADLRKDYLNAQLVGTFLRRLHTRYWDLTMLREKGDKLFLRNQGLRKRLVFRLWREQVQNQRQPDISGLQQLEGFSQSLPPMRQNILGRSMIIPNRTPIVGLRTPNWKTTGRRRGLLGNSSFLGLGPDPHTPMGSPPESPLKRFTGFGKSTLGRVAEPDDEDDGSGTLVGSSYKDM
ncbi:Sfi1 spindle body protein-domain-containing protein [Geopyxis carbonaria]|nr:Sfi1 spindle body protein-domain-containing protein [Geopyxis carbonaria]